jgi:hypothetical protein
VLGVTASIPGRRSCHVVRDWAIRSARPSASVASVTNAGAAYVTYSGSRNISSQRSTSLSRAVRSSTPDPSSIPGSATRAR